MTLSTLQWVCAAVGAVLVGVSKTGMSGLSILAVALFAYVLESGKQASGLILPLFIFGDIIAVLSYRTHTQWRHLGRVFPWTALGVIIGYFALDRISDHATRLLIGGIIVALTLISYRRRRRPVDDQGAPLHASTAIFVGVLAGFVTLIANAAGPLMAVYLLAMRLPKMQYMGTAAMFFMLLNLFKVPFMASLGLVTPASFELNLRLLPAVLLGALLGRWLLKRIDQRLFENLVLALSGAAGLLLLL
jgi:uncharacterized membrane protein YfcA